MSKRIVPFDTMVVPNHSPSLNTEGSVSRKTQPGASVVIDAAVASVQMAQRVAQIDAKDFISFPFAKVQG